MVSVGRRPTLSTRISYRINGGSSIGAAARVAVGLTISALLATTAGCSNGSSTNADEPTPSAASTTPTPTPTVMPDDKAAAEASKAIRRYYATYEAVSKHPSAGTKPYEEVARGQDLRYLRIEWRQYRNMKVHAVGHAKIAKMAVTDVDLKADPATVKADVCYDVSKSDVIYNDRPHVSVVTAKRKDQQLNRLTLQKQAGRWYVTRTRAATSAAWTGPSDESQASDTWPSHARGYRGYVRGDSICDRWRGLFKIRQPHRVVRGVGASPGVE